MERLAIHDIWTATGIINAPAASFEMQPALLPGKTDLLVLPASDEPVPLNLEWELLDDQSLLPGPPH